MSEEKLCTDKVGEASLPPLTEDEKHDAFEWLRLLAMRTDQPREAYVALRAWSELKTIHSAVASNMQPLCEYHRKGELEMPETVGDDLCVACRISYLEAQEGLLEEWQQRAKRAEETIAEVQRPLDAEMARLNATVVLLNEENERLRKAMPSASGRSE